MLRSDRMLFVIVVGAFVLVGVAFAVVLLRPEAEYGADDSPEGVVRNYLIALEKGDYERARGYLSPSLENRPEDANVFARQLETAGPFNRGSASIVGVDSAVVRGNQATVEIQMSVFYGGGPFDSSTRDITFAMDLLQDEDGTWNLIGGESYLGFWSNCWKDEESYDCR